MTSHSFGRVLFALFLLAIAALNIILFLSLAKPGDERRRMIAEKAGMNTLGAIAAYLLLCVVKNAVLSVTQGVPGEQMNPLILLTVIAIIYSAQLLYFKRKYGD